MPHSKCPSEQELTAYQLGDLSAAAASAVGRHLEGCPDCEARVARLDEVADPVIAVLRQYPPPSVSAPAQTPVPPNLLLRDPPTERLRPEAFAPQEPQVLAGYRILGELGRG